MAQPLGYRVEKINSLKDLEKDDLYKVLEQVLEHLGLEVYKDTTPDYTEVIVQKRD